MKHAFHPEAEAEFNAAIDWYEERTPGLGFAFAGEVLAAVQRALAFPFAWQVLDGDIRRTLVNRYLYGVVCTGTRPLVYRRSHASAPAPRLLAQPPGLSLPCHAALMPCFPPSPTSRR